MSAGFEYKKTRDELLKELSINLDFLLASCARYDQGHVHEANRIAAVAYTLLHDGPMTARFPSVSIARQLDIKGNMRFLNTSDIDYSTPLAHNQWRNPVALVFVSPIGTYKELNDITYRPILNHFLNGKLSTLSFESWSDTPIFEMWNGNLLTRSSFILAMSNQDGGRHVDPGIRDVTYHWMSRGRGLCGYHKNPDGDYEVIMPLSMNGNLFELPAGMTPVPNAHWATMRQIGFEIHASFVLMGILPKWKPTPQQIAKNLPNEHPYRRLVDLPPHRRQ
ncbi:hypothetical protein [Sphingomonas sp. MS122]|uniref:hypothetical protein n=1 Tax=Sphingomonas sp. MS122 TaxID=3412683 RepID=UPI003C2C7E21